MGNFNTEALKKLLGKCYLWHEPWVFHKHHTCLIWEFSLHFIVFYLNFL